MLVFELQWLIKVRYITSNCWIEIPESASHDEIDEELKMDPVVASSNQNGKYNWNWRIYIIVYENGKVNKNNRRRYYHIKIAQKHQGW